MELSKYKFITRKDTNTYTITDILSEILEWEEIISTLSKTSPAYSIRSVEISNRLTKVMAKTGKKQGISSLGYMVISGNYLHYHSDWAGFHSTLAHEVIHSFPGCFNHGENFKRFGRILMNNISWICISRLGYDKGYMDFLYNKNKFCTPSTAKYILTCERCGQKIYRNRKCKLVKYPLQYKCGKCGGLFNVDVKDNFGNYVSLY